MKKFFALVFCTVLTFSANASADEEDLLPVTESMTEASPLALEDDPFDPDKEEIGQVRQRVTPTCDSPDFVEAVVENVRNYLDRQKVSSSVAMRRNKLILNHLTTFESVSATGFSPETDVNTANALITVKINRRIRPENIVLCRQKGGNKVPIYVIAFPYSGSYRVYVVNVDPKNSDFTAVSFWYS